MTIKEILNKTDHTFLKQTATWADIKKLCDEALEFHTASVCVPPCFVRQVKDAYSDRLKICTVIGFPNGYNTTETKVFETKQAVADGADEIDMVIQTADNKYSCGCSIHNYWQNKRYSTPEGAVNAWNAVHDQRKKKDS